jgi:agmatinase
MKAFHLASEPENPKYVLIGIPYDETETYQKGAAKGVESFRTASESIETYSLRLARDLEALAFKDEGDIVCPKDPEKAIEAIEARAASVFERKVFPVVLGGEHTVTLGVLKGALATYPDLRVIVLDAHLDLRHEYNGERINHATWAHRATEILGPERMMFFGIRSGIPDEIVFARMNRLNWFPKIDIRMLEQFALGYPLYLSIDMDALDPALCPGVGNPEPGGLIYEDLISLFVILSNYKFVGMDLVEINPAMDAGEVTSVVGANLVREALLAASLRRSR